MNQTVLIISPVPSHPQNAGNRARVFKLISCLKALGYGVHFAHIQETLGDADAMFRDWGADYHPIPYQSPITKSKARLSKRLDARILRRVKAFLGDDPRYNFQVDDWYDPGIDSYLAELAAKLQPDIVIAEYVFFSKGLDCFGPQTLKVIDTHDVFSNRYQLYLKKNQPPRWFSTSEREEIKGLRRADVVFSIQDQEASFFASRLQRQKVIAVGHFIDLVPPQPRAQTNKLLFVGSSNPINVQGVKYFLDHVFNAIIEQLPGIQLILGGGVCEGVPAHRNCLKIGRIENLEAHYLNADLVINPVLFGTGLKIKNIEALGFSKPLVTTSAGAAGLEDGIGQAFSVADTPQAFASTIVRLLANRMEYQTLAKNAFEFAQRWQETQLKNLSLGLSGYPS
ncbi:MAG: glycosyltransferase family 4 protein [Cyanobacteria bacterium P01_A01_bin.114]